MNLRVLKHEDSKVSVFKPRRFFNLHVLKHEDFGTRRLPKFCLKSLKYQFKISIEERKLNLLRKNFNNMPLHTLVIDFLKKKIRKSNIFLNLRVLYMEIFTLKAYNSEKKQQMTEIF